jgi:hypothetical protein
VLGDVLAFLADDGHQLALELYDPRGACGNHDGLIVGDERPRLAISDIGLLRHLHFRFQELAGLCGTAEVVEPDRVECAGRYGRKQGHFIKSALDAVPCRGGKRVGIDLVDGTKVLRRNGSRLRMKLAFSLPSGL